MEFYLAFNFVKSHGSRTEVVVVGELLVAVVDAAAELEEYGGVPRRKRSEGKATWPGRKQVFRRCREDGIIAGDTIGLDTEGLQGATLLEPIMLGGRRVVEREPLDRLQQRCRGSLNTLPAPLKSLTEHADYPVDISGTVRALADDIDRGAI